MKNLLGTLMLVMAAGAPLVGHAHDYRDPRRAPVVGNAVDPFAARAPWQQPWEYDTGGDNDRRPELPYYQQGRGQQTGGPARNLLPDDGLHLFIR